MTLYQHNCTIIVVELRGNFQNTRVVTISLQDQIPNQSKLELCLLEVFCCCCSVFVNLNLEKY